MRSSTLAPFVVALLMMAPSVHAAPGDLDTTFGVGGFIGRDAETPIDPPVRVFAFTSHLSLFPEITARLDSAGRLVTGGNTREVAFTVRRYTATGTLDASWGSGGIVVTPEAPGLVSALAVQPDGKVVAVGSLPAVSLAVVRYASDGSLDPSFGSGGIVTTAYTDADSVAIQPDGKIIVGGGALVRFLADGTLDPSFGSGGVQSIGGGFEALALLVQPDGAIVAVDDSGARRWLSDGTPVPRVRTGGFVSLMNVSKAGHQVALQPDGKLLVTGAGLWRLNPDGSLDGGFGTGGVALQSPLYGVVGVAVQADGRVLAGLSGIFFTGAEAVGVWRVLPSGLTDPTFGSYGLASTSADSPGLPYETSVGSQLAVRPDGGIVVTGSRAVFGLLGGECGNGTVERGEDCDDGNLADGDGCDAHCCIADADHDGRCDAIDPCTGGVAVKKAKMKFTVTPAFSLRQPQTFSLVADAILPIPLAPPLDPLLHGIRLVVASQPPSAPLDFTASGGAFSDGTGSGWSVHTAASGFTTWKWVDKLGKQSRGAVQYPGSVIGITVRDRSARTPGLVHVTATGKSFNSSQYRPMIVDQPPFTLRIVFDTPVAQSGQCAEIAFTGAAPNAPYCVQVGNKTNCTTP